MFRVVHISDPHVLSPGGVEWRAILFNKRITGYLNLIRNRGRVYRRAYLDIVLEAASREADHLVVTGDITNLALESEFADARSLLDEVARRTDVTVVPGNHDIYLPSLLRRRRFPHHFGHFLRSDLPELSLDLPAGSYPCVKLRGPVAIIALSSAVPRPPFDSSGSLGPVQLAAFEAVLAHPEVTRRTPVILVHHPPVDRRSRLARRLDGLVDAAAFRRCLGGLARGLVLFGHLHRRVRYRLTTAAGGLDVVGASGARYSIGADGAVERIEALVLDPAGGALQPVPIPAQPAAP
jgi:3',5'-cyclic AMP phosphodiesterase CpdA